MLNSMPPFRCIGRSCASAMRETAKEVYETPYSERLGAPLS
jgi:hypothetical protein